MSELATNLAAAWRDRADREAAIFPGGHVLTKPEEYERSMVDFRRAVSWFHYWTGIGAAS